MSRRCATRCGRSPISPKRTAPRESSPKATYAIEPNHSFATFEIGHFGTSTNRGRFNKTSGTVTLDKVAKTGVGVDDPDVNFYENYYSTSDRNYTSYKNPEVDKLVFELQNTFDPAKQDEIAAKIHAKAVDDAVMIWVYHDTTPRALSAKIKKYVQAQSWFQDLAPVSI